MARTRHDLEALWSNCAREARGSFGRHERYESPTLIGPDGVGDSFVQVVQCITASQPKRFDGAL